MHGPNRLARRPSKKSLKIPHHYPLSTSGPIAHPGTYKFVKGCAQHGDAVEFTRNFAREVRKCRMSDYSLIKQVYACSAICDEVTEAAIEAQIEVGTFPHGPAARNRRFERGAVAADANANQVELANQAVGTLTQFLEWFRVTF